MAAVPSSESCLCLQPWAWHWCQLGNVCTSHGHPLALPLAELPRLVSGSGPGSCDSNATLGAVTAVLCCPAQPSPPRAPLLILQERRV